MLPLQKPSPWEEGGWPKARRMRGQVLQQFHVTQGGFRRLRAASSFAHGGKGTKAPPGTAQDGHYVPIFAHPTLSGPSGHLPLTGGVGPGPHYGGRPIVRCCWISGAQKGSGLRDSFRATGPWVCKNCRGCGSKTAPGFSQPTPPIRVMP